MYVSLTDQCYRTIELTQRPLRIVSLVPSQTELLIDLGLEENLVGVTRFCVHPAGLTDRIQVVGGTKKIVTSRLYELQPDLIICNKEENTPEIVLACDSIAPTYVSDIATLEDALEMIADIGKLTGATFKSKSIINNTKIAYNGLKTKKAPLKALYLIWQNPFMSVGGDTFIHDMMLRAGFENVCGNATRYPELQLEDMIALQPDVLFLSSEPYVFTNDDEAVLVSAFAKANLTTKIRHVDGEMFSWYGSRLLQAPAYFEKLSTDFLA